MDTPNTQQPKTPRIHTGETLVVKPGAAGDLVVYKSENPAGHATTSVTTDTKLTPVLILTGDPTLLTHPIHELRRAIGAYLETQSRGKVLGPRWADPVTAPTPPRVGTSTSDLGFDLPTKGR